MAHRTCSAAFHAAHILFEKFVFVARPPETLAHGIPNLQATEAHVGIIIDRATNAWEVALLREQLVYWQKVMLAGADDTHTAEQIALFVRRMIETLDDVPHYSAEERPDTITTSVVMTTGSWTVQMKLTKAAIKATEAVCYYFEVAPIDQQPYHTDNLIRREMIRTIDSCLGLGKALRALPLMRALDEQLRAGRATPRSVLEALAAARSLFEALPNYEDRRDEVKLLA